MKYTRLTKEQFEELHQEFINFLATQSITAAEWESIKKDKPEVAEEELDIFSDLVWEGVLDKVEYLEHFSANQMFLFNITSIQINLIAVKIEKDDIDIRTPAGYQWLQKNLMDDSVNLYTSSKVLKEDRNKDIFALIQQGAVITKGDLYRYFDTVVNES
ncbi:hypothetical protein FHG64_02315 [Antarcticibacterium flavum]|uniref:Histidyl-tRNA synthetase n=1 Tax=Antarcticibacterium flavum TaxID=2058175 RepID=A0A5B7X0V9_9FLAO|nr:MULTISPECIES: DUF6495 family protein [Antarcticibacterium]MCM4161172.1 hypothetical protein [Antarcticibacterium sp. W02-3]QCY68322.1 hypothetical protein FHG64_02315 [Antarcticibacterium flavum]